MIFTEHYRTYKNKYEQKDYMRSNKNSKKIIEAVEELCGFTEKEFDKCPWIKDLSIEEAINELRNELKELEEELKNEKDIELAKEAGDVFRDALLILFLVSRKTKIEEERIIRYVFKKAMWRKPWIDRDENVNKEQAVKIWFDRKKEEKIEL